MDVSVKQVQGRNYLTNHDEYEIHRVAVNEASALFMHDNCPWRCGLWLPPRFGHDRDDVTQSFNLCYAKPKPKFYTAPHA